MNDQLKGKNGFFSIRRTPLFYNNTHLHLRSLDQRTAVLQTAKFGNLTPPSKLRRLSWWGLVVKQLFKLNQDSISIVRPALNLNESPAAIRSVKKDKYVSSTLRLRLDCLDP